MHAWASTLPTQCWRKRKEVWHDTIWEINKQLDKQVNSDTEWRRGEWRSCVIGHSVLIVAADVHIQSTVTTNVCCISRWKQGMLGSVYRLFSCQNSGCINLHSWWATGSRCLQFPLVCFIVRLCLLISRSLSLSLPVFSFALFRSRSLLSLSH